MAEKLGLTWHTDVDQLMATPEKANGWGAFTLGVSDTTPLEMANAYATLAADGMYCEATPVLSITDSRRQARRGRQSRSASRRSRWRRPAPPWTPPAASPGTRRRRDRAAPGPPPPACAAAVGRPVGGKTGTTDDTRAAWFVGITPQLAAASFIADPDYPFHYAGDGNAPKPINAVSGLLRRGLAGVPVRDFTPPTAITANVGAR